MNTLGSVPGGASGWGRGYGSSWNRSKRCRAASTAGLSRAAAAVADPAPLPDLEGAAFAVGLEVDGGDDALAGEHRQGEVAEAAPGRRQVGLEAVRVAEEALEPPALDHQRVERREQVDDRLGRRRRDRRGLGRDPVARPGQALDADRQQPAAADPGFDQRGERGGAALGAEPGDRVEADEPLGLQRPVEQEVELLPRRGRPRTRAPAEMPLGQVEGLEHAVAFADGQRSDEEGELQRPLGRLAAGPGVVLLHQLVVVDVADRQRPVAADPGQHPAQVRRRDRAEPAVGRRPLPPHLRHHEAVVAARDVGERMGPVFEHRFLHGQGVVEVGAAVAGDAGEEDMVVRALDHVDGVDLHVAQVLDRGAGRRRSAAERRRGVEPLRAGARIRRASASDSASGRGAAAGTGPASGAPAVEPDLGGAGVARCRARGGTRRRAGRRRRSGSRRGRCCRRAAARC